MVKNFPMVIEKIYEKMNMVLLENIEVDLKAVILLLQENFQSKMVRVRDVVKDKQHYFQKIPNLD